MTSRVGIPGISSVDVATQIAAAAEAAAIAAAATDATTKANAAQAAAIADAATKYSPAVGSDNWLKAWGSNIDALIRATAITRDANEAATGANVIWPDGTAGVYAGTASTTFAGAIDAYTVTYVGGATKTVTQPAVTRDTAGAVTNRPAMTVA